jgi:multidrug efflux pump
VADGYLLTVGGSNSTFNAGGGTVVLKDWDQRKAPEDSADNLAAKLNRELSAVTGARVIATVRAPFQRGGGGGGGGQSLDFIASGPEYDQVAKWIAPILDDAIHNPGLSRPRLDYEPTSPRLLVDIDREKAAALGVSTQDIGRTLETMFGSRKATTYLKEGQEYDVMMQADLSRRQTENDLNGLYVRGGQGQLVPLASLVKTSVHGDTPNRRRVDKLRSITLTVQLNPGYTVAEAVAFFKAEAAKQPGSMVVAWGGQAKDYLEASGAVGAAFGLALVLVFLVLAAQFESFIHPAVIMTTVPLAALGGLFGLLMAGSTLNTYSEIGLIILIGIAAKNGILIVEFANQLRDQGRSVREAVIESASLRLRPIIMTSIAAAFGALPLLLASGPGAASRRTIGVVIFVGAIFSSLLTLFVAPVFYNLLARFTRSPDALARAIAEFEKNDAREPQPMHVKAAE